MAPENERAGLYAIKERPELFKKVVLLCSSGYLKRSPRPLIFGSHIPYFYLYIKRWLSKQGVLKNLMNVVYDVVDNIHEIFQDALF